MKNYNNFKDDTELDQYPVIRSTSPEESTSTNNDSQANHTTSFSINPSNSYFKQFRREYVNYFLLNRFPIKLIVTSAVFFSLTNLSLIAVQLIGVLAGVPFYKMAAGVWVGIFMIILQIISAYLCKFNILNF